MAKQLNEQIFKYALKEHSLTKPQVYAVNEILMQLKETKGYHESVDDYIIVRLIKEKYKHEDVNNDDIDMALRILENDMYFIEYRDGSNSMYKIETEGLKVLNKHANFFEYLEAEYKEEMSWNSDLMENEIIEDTETVSFLNQKFEDINLNKIGLEDDITEILNMRIEEIKTGLEYNTPLSVIFLCGSTLEGILFGIASKNINEFNQATAAPKDDDNRVRAFKDWTLNSYIDVAKELGYINKGVKQYSHELRDFRNYIHPNQQLASEFNPDKETAEISFQVLKGAISQIAKKIEENS